MLDFLNIILTPEFGFSVLRITTPVLLAALGALISNKAGVMNISLEGTMLTSALTGVIVSAFTKSATIGLFAAVAVGVLMAAILAYFSLELKSDIVLTGIALNLFASGGTVFLLYLVANDKGISVSLPSKVLPNINIPIIENIPVIGEIFSGHNILTYVAFILVAVVFIFLYKTTLGLRIRAVGENPSAVGSVGIGVKNVQYIALLISGFLAGLGGAYMSMGYVSWFSRDMTAGRGFIALAAEAMGNGTPIGTMVSSLLFGFADALSNSIHGFNIPSEFVQMVPYLATIVGLVVYSIRKKSKTKKIVNE